MALPKHKKSKSKRGMRRTHHKIATPNISACPQCGEMRLSHRVCAKCGSYKGRTVIESEND